MGHAHRQEQSLFGAEPGQQRTDVLPRRFLYHGLQEALRRADIRRPQHFQVLPCRVCPPTELQQSADEPKVGHALHHRLLLLKI